MADADLFLDLSSSPDPLADGIPSSVRPSTRRITKSQMDMPSSVAKSSSRRISRGTSPRKRTFQLNLGDERSPQRIRVTVEAHQDVKREDVNRKLFATASPSRSARRRDTITATTTTVPLNDEPGAFDTPPKRGRQRRTSNGTPMPRSRKRAGTPISRKVKHPRYDDDALSQSEAEMEIDALEDVGAGASGKTPKSKAKLRKTPRKPPVSVPSSQRANSAAKKRGRPRKAPVPKEADIADPVPKTADAMLGETNANPDAQLSRDELDMASDEIPGGRMDSHTARAAFQAPPRRRSGVTSLLHSQTLEESARAERPAASPASSVQESFQNDDHMMSEDYQGMEAHSDLESEATEATHDRQDTIADASEFSMIALESLPSFQASFQGGAAEPSSDQPEMGEETSRIINGTLESLRRSWQAEREGNLLAEETENNLRGEESRVEDRTDALNQSTMTANYTNTGRLRPLPLSRQVLVGRGTVDDSFSTIPDSILHATTPGRLPMKVTASEDQHHVRQTVPYEDSFSEIPNEVLEAATPRPPGRTQMLPGRSPAVYEELDSSPHPSVRMSHSSYGSNRLPTPDETSSSNAGSKKTHEEEREASLGPQEHTDPIQHSDLPSSPPIKTRPRGLKYGPSDLQRELNSVQKKPVSSPQTQGQPSSKMSSNQLPSLEVPHPTIRPSLSPIVRVGRTLQNVMSDNSSPEGREHSLRSPFRGSASSDHTRQLSVPRSPSPSLRNRSAQNKPQPSNSRVEMNPGRTSQSSKEPEDRSGVGSSKNSGAESLRDRRSQSRERRTSVENYSISNSIRAALSNNDGGNRPMNGNGSRQMNSWHASPQRAYHHGQSASETHDTSAHDDGLHSEQDNNHHDESMHDTDMNPGDGFDEHDDDDDDDDVDVWDIEASRTSPVRQPEPTHNTAAKSPKADNTQSRRTKVPSPWRRTSRRLIFKDNIASSSQIEIEESSQSEREENPSVGSSQPPASQVPTSQAPSQAPISQALSSQAATQQAPTPQIPILPAPMSRAPTSQAPVLPALTSQAPTLQKSISPPQQDTQRRTMDPLRAPETMREEPPERERSMTPNHSDGFEEYAGHADFDDHGDDDEDSVNQEEPGVPEQSHDGPDLLMDEEQLERDAQAELDDFYGIPARDAPIDASEPSSTTKQTKEISTLPETAAPPRSKRFGGFDLLSFFSSPANLPTMKDPDPEPRNQNQPPIAQPNLSETRQPKEPSRGLFSTGLFPSILPTNELRPSTEQPPSSSPGSTLRSGDTVPDTHEPSMTASPSPAGRTASETPSTPEHQDFSPIAEKQNFTPRDAELGERGSLFGSKQTNPLATRENANVHYEEMEVEEAEDEDVDEDLESSDDQDSSALTEGSEYERVPPREKPSQWDRHLSPTKSCLRSPLKPPPAPGRAVAFSSNINTFAAAHQARNTLQDSGNTLNGIVSQGPPLLRPRFEGKENQLPHPSQQISANHDDSLDKDKPDADTAVRGTAATATATAHALAATARPATKMTSTTSTANTTNSAAASTTRTAIATTTPLSPTTWTRNHWTRLDDLLRMRYFEPARFQQMCSSLPPLPSPTQSPSSPQSPSSRGDDRNQCSSALLGKEVFAQDARLILQEWHLDVIDAFRAEINAGVRRDGAGSWDAETIAKRVFALIVGAERRRAARAAAANIATR